MKTIVTIIFIILALIGIYFLSSIFSKFYSKHKVQNWLDINFSNTFKIISFEKAPFMSGDYYLFTVQEKDNIRIKGTIGFVKNDLIALNYSESYYYTQEENTLKFKDDYNESKSIKTIQRAINKNLPDGLFVEATKFSPSAITSYTSTEKYSILIYSIIELEEVKTLLQKSLSNVMVQNNWDNIKLIYLDLSKEKSFDKKYPLRHIPESIHAFEMTRTLLSETQSIFEWRETEESQNISNTLFYLWQPQQKDPMNMSLYNHEFLE